MSDWLFKKINWFVGCLAIVTLFGLIALVANIEIKDLDLWLHLAVGKYITHYLVIPKVDILSCTITNTPWINHEWLFQSIVYSVYSAGGISGLISLKVWIVFLTFLVLLFLANTHEMKFGPIIVLLLVVLVYQWRLTLRPDMFSLLFFVLYFALLEYHLKKRWFLWAIILIQITWTNMHGFFVIGPILVALALTSEWAKRSGKLPFDWNSANRLSDDEYKRLKLLLPIVLLCCLVNPHFVKGALYPINVLFSLGHDSKIFFSQIQELQKPLQWGTLFSLGSHLHYKLLILISAISFAFNYRKIDIKILLLWLMVLLFSLSAVRNVVFFAFAAYLTFLANTQNISFQKFLPVQYHSVKIKAACTAILSALFIIWIIDYGNSLLLRGYYDFDNYERKNEYRGVSLRNYPAQAADFLVQNKITGNFFNDFNSGAYLLGRTYPNIKVFIDGRTELYGSEFYKKYRDILKGNTNAFDEAVEKYQLTGAFLGYVYVPASAKMMRYLYEHKEWVLVYFDYDASVFLKNVPQNRDWINRLRVNLKKRQALPADLLRIGTHKVQPYRYVNRAFALYGMGLHQKAMQEAVEALRIEPYNVKAHKLIGNIYFDQGQFNEAFESLRKAKLLAPKDMQIRHKIALAFFHLGRIDDAKEQCQRVLDHDPNDPDAVLLMSKIYVAQRKYDEMMIMLNNARKHNSLDGDAFLEIGNLLSGGKEYHRAQEVYILGLGVQPQSKQIQEMLDMNRMELNNGR